MSEQEYARWEARRLEGTAEQGSCAWCGRQGRLVGEVAYGRGTSQSRTVARLCADCLEQHEQGAGVAHA